MLQQQELEMASNSLQWHFLWTDCHYILLKNLASKDGTIGSAGGRTAPRFIHSVPAESAHLETDTA